jgi:hypothetical protein
LDFVQGSVGGGILVGMIVTLVVRVVRVDFLDGCGHLEWKLAPKYIGRV